MVTEHERKEAREALIDAAAQLGLPLEFGELMARELRTTTAMRRMQAYLLGVRPHRMEDIADELLAIAEQRDTWFEQKRNDQANAAITAFYNRPRLPEE